jgi:Protein of unknown function (DUF1761)
MKSACRPGPGPPDFRQPAITALMETTMAFAGMNMLAILAAAIAAFLIGGAWYGILGKQWMAALGKTRDQLGSPVRAMIVSFVAELVMAFMLAGVMGHMGEVTLRNGVVSGALVWLGFVATTLITNHAYQGSKPSLTLIDGGHWLAVLIAMGAVIGWFGV